MLNERNNFKVNCKVQSMQNAFAEVPAVGCRLPVPATLAQHSPIPLLFSFVCIVYVFHMPKFMRLQLALHGIKQKHQNVILHCRGHLERLMVWQMDVNVQWKLAATKSRTRISITTTGTTIYKRATQHKTPSDRCSFVPCWPTLKSLENFSRSTVI